MRKNCAKSQFLVIEHNNYISNIITIDGVDDEKKIAYHDAKEDEKVRNNNRAPKKKCRKNENTFFWSVPREREII
jgi:hypothetical protein